MLTPTRIPPADPKRQRTEGEPAQVVSLDGWHGRERSSPVPPEQERTGPTLAVPWSAQPMVAIPQAKLEEILDRQDKLVAKLIDLGEHCDQNSAAIVSLRRLLQELLRRLEV